ncbi:hypothetical protein CEUSTIGMA_g10178.t1 [Chlamydomonas eustigma]|uniref:Uncharacterized protein n=1 Tax=Chlamydomonas eustigma TaxID=1157962 RepID=A0A250XIL1_9CHLO|nr:hypothetical protein CEUSTIGMA_g10178.t1 [Chlamydomonas eustigma]|eukprot:GAX82752.1 hypothetical protein CEUSTIGMA_g10178.t1 [Chlamydomonas eustigma]
MSFKQNTIRFRGGSQARTILAMAKPWRPHVDDVDRLSRGEGAKIRGTGCRDIPHRLNEQEHAGFKAAKKKGFAAVRGTGYRKERKGNPLPNIFRQWCDAKEMPCIVIEQDMLGGSRDNIVVDLTPMRLLDTQKVKKLIMDLAASMAVQHMLEGERSLLDVPFNIRPLALPGSSASTSSSSASSWYEHYSWAALRTSTTTPKNVLRVRPPAEHLSSLRSTQNISPGPALEPKGSISYLTERMVENEVQDSSFVAQAGGDQDALNIRIQHLEACLEQQRLSVRMLKEVDGLSNSHEKVQAEVKILTKLKVDLDNAREAAVAAVETHAINQRRSKSARLTALNELFAMDPKEVSDAGAGVVGDRTAVGLQIDSKVVTSRQLLAPQELHSDESVVEMIEDSADIGENVLEASAQEGSRFSGVDFPDSSHPYCQAAVWQLPAEPLFFSADRSLAKAFAREVIDRLQHSTSA